MRLRNVKGAREEMLVNRFVVQEPAQYKGKWKEFFGNDNYEIKNQPYAQFCIENFVHTAERCIIQEAYL